MSTSYLIKNVAVLGGAPGDLLLRDGVIADVGAAPADAEVIDGTGLVALPGLVDLHTHLREPGREDAETVETGTRAAESAIAPSSASRSPASPTVTAPIG